MRTSDIEFSLCGHTPLDKKSAHGAESALTEKSSMSAQRTPDTLPAHQKSAIGAQPASVRKRPLCAVLVLIALLLAANALLCFLLEPFRGSSEEMWRGFAADAQIDTVIAGTSQGLSGIDPSALDEALGSHSYNMSTNMQCFANSLDAIETAYEQRGIKRAVLVLDHEMLDAQRYDNFRADASFHHGKEAILPLSGKIKDALSFVTDPSFIGKPLSITYWFPWIYNRSTDISLNVREKMAGRVLDETNHRLANGFEPSDDVVDQSIPFITMDEADAWDAQNPDLDTLSLSDENRAVLEQIVQFCRTHAITLYAVIAPYPNWLNIYNKDSYLAMDDTLSGIFSGDGVSFTDYNLTSKEDLPLTTENFKDVGHMNTKGAEIFSSFLGEQIKEAENN